MRQGERQGHLLLGPRKALVGRVVESRMLNALKSGCLRIGHHSFYSLDRLLSVDEEKLRQTAHVLINASNHGSRICPASSADVEKLCNWGKMIITSKLVRHHTMQKAIHALHRAGQNPPTLEDRVLQVALGGDNPDSLMIGKFLPCERTFDNPNIQVKCACGFVPANGRSLKPFRNILRRKCPLKTGESKNVRANRTIVHSWGTQVPL